MKPEELATLSLRRRSPVQPMQSSLKAENQIRQLTQKVHRNIAVLSTIQNNINYNIYQQSPDVFRMPLNQISPYIANGDLAKRQILSYDNFGMSPHIPMTNYDVYNDKKDFSSIRIP